MDCVNAGAELDKMIQFCDGKMHHSMWPKQWMPADDDTCSVSGLEGQGLDEEEETPGELPTLGLQLCRYVQCITGPVKRPGAPLEDVELSPLAQGSEVTPNPIPGSSSRKRGKISK